MMPLGELPGVMARTARPEHLALGVGDNDAYIRPEAISIDHGGISRKAYKYLFYKYSVTAGQA